MKQEGFHIQIATDLKTGFIFGGNRWNCGTWMDKMGSSNLAGNRGQPATPRDGSAVEIVALSKSVINFLSDLHEKNIYPFEGVCNGHETWTYKFWSDKIKENFEPLFHISDKCDDQYVNRRMIYKDTYGASFKWMDFQLRPNFLIAMSLAPDLFDREHAKQALKLATQVLVGPLGIKTLDPSDWKYRGDYDNSLDCQDESIAHGFNYHQGPEWLWPMGHYLRARLLFSDEPKKEIPKLNRIVSKHLEHLKQSEWFGLPELTNSDGKFCLHSCSIQAWSHSTLLDFIYLRDQLMQ